MKDMTNSEGIEMMSRCREEIRSLRKTIDHLKPKADAYDNIVIVLGLLPRQSVGMGEDLVWVLDKRIRELTPLVPPGSPSLQPSTLEGIGAKSA